MIIEILLSLITLCITAVLCSFTSGGFARELIQPALLAGVPLILAVMIFISGNGKAFIKLFAGKKKLKAASLSELKEMERAACFAGKALVFICLFFTLISGIYLYLNIDDLQTLGPNLSTVICSIHYLAFFSMLLLTLKGKLKCRIISFMAEEEIPSEKIKTPAKKIVLRIVKIVLCIAAVTGLYFLIISTDTINNSSEEPLSFFYLRDLPSLVYVFIPTLLLLLISGNFKNFFKALKYSFTNEKLSVSKKAISVNAVETARMLFFFEGLMCTFGGFMGMLCNLQDRKALGICFTVSCIPLIYALFINLILLPVEAKLSKQAD